MTQQRSMGALFPIWAIIRMWVLLSGLQLIPYPNSQYLFSDVRLYDWWAGNIVDGHFPINDPMWQYPPIAALLFAAGYLIHPEVIGFALLALIADAAILIMLARASRRHATRTVVPAWLWVATPLAMGPIALGRFDVFVTAMAVAALLATSSYSRGAFIAIGTLLKVWPVLALVAIKRRFFMRTISAFVTTTVVLTVGLTLWWPNSFAFIAGQQSRGLQIESLGALPYMLWNVGPSRVVVDLQYGSIEVIAQGTWWVGLFLTVIAVILFGILGLWRIQGRLEKVPDADVMLTAVLTAMVTSRVLSPQYNLWALGMIAVCAFAPQPRYRMISSLIFLSALCGQLLYPWLYVQFESGGFLATGVHVLRIATLVSATALCWLNLRSRLLPKLAS